MKEITVAQLRKQTKYFFDAVEEGNIIRVSRKGKPIAEIGFIGVSESPEDSESLWIRVTAPEDEDRESELIRYSADKSMDILLDYGYHLLIMPTRLA